MRGDSMNEWQPIETAPKDGTEILVYHNECCSVREWGKNDDGDEIWLPRIRGFFPTHWMPLPNPPKQEKEIV
jgi:hypothetical protein